jgi:hypothetical protein
MQGKAILISANQEADMGSAPFPWKKSGSITCPSNPFPVLFFQ